MLDIVKLVPSGNNSSLLSVFVYDVPLRVKVKDAAPCFVEFG